MNPSARGRSPEEFDWILAQFNRHDIEPVIIAGQAVNIWGKTFREWDTANNPTTPKINDLLPLTSNDMELLEIQGISTLEKFKGVVGRDKTDPFAKAASPDTATYHLKNKTGLFKVQVLAWLPGASREEAQQAFLQGWRGPFLLTGCSSTMDSELLPSFLASVLAKHPLSSSSFETLNAEHI